VTLQVCEQITDEPEEKWIPVTLSLGVYAAEETGDPELLLKGAKETLRLAKAAGGNRVVISSLPAEVKGSLEEKLDCQG
jgi:c-di-AMP phosphodiesterase-like protein